MRRFVVGCLFAAAFLVLFSKSLLAFAATSALRWKMGADLSFTKVCFSKQGLVFKNIHLQTEAVELDASSLCCSLGGWQKPLKIFVHVERPRLLIHQERPFISSGAKSSWIKLSLSASDGQFEWKTHVGKFSYKDHTLAAEMDGGSLRIAHERDRIMNCTFEKWRIDPFSSEELSLQGRLTGAACVEILGGEILSAKGSIQLEDVQAEHRMVSCGAQRLDCQGEWQGQIFLPDLKGAVQGGWIKREGRECRDLLGHFFSHPELGIRWTAEGPGFLWEGKGFVRQKELHWVQSALAMGSMHCEVEGTHSQQGWSWAVQGSGIDLTLLKQLLPPSLQMQGELSGRLETGGGEWNVQSYLIEHLALQGPFGSLCCKEALGSIQMKQGMPSGSIALTGGKASWKEHQVSEADLSFAVREGKLVSGAASCLLNGNPLKGDWSERFGSVQVNESKIPMEGLIEVSQCGVVIQTLKASLLDLHIELEGSLAFSCDAFVSAALMGAVDQAGLKAKINSSHIEGSGSLFQPIIDWSWKGDASVEALQYKELLEGKGSFSFDTEEHRFEGQQVEGLLAIGQARLPIHLSIGTEKQTLLFDGRVSYGCWEAFRLNGKAAFQPEGIACSFTQKSHLCGAPLQISDYVLGHAMNVSCGLDWNHLLAASKLLKEIHPLFASLLQAPIEGSCLFEAAIKDSEHMSLSAACRDLVWQGRPIQCAARAAFMPGKWRLEQCVVGDLSLTGFGEKEGGQWRVESGSLAWGSFGSAAFTATLSPEGSEVFIGSLAMDLKQLFGSLQGSIEGRGICSIAWQDGWNVEGDFDLACPALHYGDLSLKNRSPLQLHYSKRGGMLLRGIDVEADQILAKIGLAQVDFSKQTVTLHHCQAALPVKTLLDYRPSSLFGWLDAAEHLELAADLSFAFDFSTLSCSIKEAMVPLFGSISRVENVDIDCSPSELKASFEWIHGQDRFIGSSAMRFEPHLCGRLAIQDAAIPSDTPLCIEWEQDKRGIAILSMEGVLGNCDLSFHRLSEGSLIGAAHLDFRYLAKLLPKRVAKVFDELKLGSGFEVRGHLIHDPRSIGKLRFQGLFSGKECELFGYQIRTLLAKLEIAPDRISLHSLKASDPAGVMKVEELTMASSRGEPWKISMPKFSLQEFRPSLLKEMGKKRPSVGPLVVRELSLTDFRGDLEASSTFLAAGELTFINSFKREHTLLDLPADVLGRIFGLDLELLIPVQGTLKLELKDGRFWLQDLQNSYSEGKRSKFFLVKEGLSPSVDLDGRIDILVKMKHYVLFTITEKFLLSIEGTLDDPEYHLQKKRRLFSQ